MISMAKSPYLSIVIPAYNESDNLKSGVLKEVHDYLKKQTYTWEVLIVDDGSTDDTRELVSKFIKNTQKFTLHTEPHRGKGGTVIAGMLAAKGEIVLFADMDQATPLHQIEKMLPHFENADIVIGSRSGREGAPLIRKTMAFGFSLLRTVILRLPYKDTQCGFKAFKNEAAKEIFRRLKVFSEKKVEGAAVTAGFDLEILYVARKLGLTVVEVPVEWSHKGTERVSAVRDSLHGLTDLIQVRINALKGLYNV